MMSQAYTHHWDEIEYFNLAVPHAEVKPELKGILLTDATAVTHLWDTWKGRCLLRVPEENSMANESVSCEVCHLIQKAQTDPPFNFSYYIVPGMTKYSGREPEITVTGS